MRILNSSSQSACVLGITWCPKMLRRRPMFDYNIEKKYFPLDSSPLKKFISNFFESTIAWLPCLFVFFPCTFLCLRNAKIIIRKKTAESERWFVIIFDHTNVKKIITVQWWLPPSFYSAFINIEWPCLSYVIILLKKARIKMFFAW